MNLSDRLEAFLTAESMALIRLVKTEAERLDLPLFIVGGSVRDLMLGRLIKDLDFTVEGDAAILAESILRKYGGKVVFHTRFGTATWTFDETTFKRLSVPRLGSSDVPPFLDLISARSESYSRPGALPTVKRSTIDDDLRRRDFTINAMALRLDGKQYGQLYDPLGGQADIDHGRVRILHDRSFIDDPTRMLRAVRYEGRYGFEIEPRTLSLIDDEAKKVLPRLSGERIRHEFDLMFEEKNPAAMLARLAELDVVKYIHPALQRAAANLPSLGAPSSEFGEYTLPEILSFKQTLGWILWLLPLSVSEIEEIARRLDFPLPLAKAARAASSLRVEYPSYASWKPSQWTFYLDEMPKLAVYAVYLVRKEPSLREYLVNWHKVKPITNGNDLKAGGLEPGPRYAEILRHLRTAWLDGEVKNAEEEKRLLDKLMR